jgi:hypothetical protein
MAKKQTRRSISVSRTTYERLKAFCEANNISMSQLVETRVNDFLGDTSTVNVTRPAAPVAAAPAPAPQPRPVAAPAARPVVTRVESPVSRPVSPAIPMTSAAARFAVDPPPPIIKPKQETVAPKPAEKRPEQIFTF